jgi:hypothetical protein
VIGVDRFDELVAAKVLELAVWACRRDTSCGEDSAEQGGEGTDVISARRGNFPAGSFTVSIAECFFPNAPSGRCFRWEHSELCHIKYRISTWCAIVDRNSCPPELFSNN